MNATDSNKTVVKDFIDGLFSQGDLGAVDAHLAEDFINHDPPFGVTPDRQGMRDAAQMMRAAFPDWHSDLHALIAEGEVVVERFTAGGTQRGEVMGVPPSGNTVSLAGINIWRLRDGLIVERWGLLDELGFARQLGVAS
ncbi:ester cyclase [Kribbella sp. NPDC054772]